MENQPQIDDCIYQIRLTDPERIARQLLTLGHRRTDLYPELDYYAKDLERQKF